jgi:hypothetical protein
VLVGAELIPALVETYAVIALLISILLITWLTKEGGVSFSPKTSPEIW